MRHKGREKVGRYYEDFQIGEVYEHWPGRTITQADNIWFSLLTMNENPIHIDEHYSQKTEWERPLVNSCLTLAIVTGMSVRDISGKAINLGWEKVKLPAPLYEGETLYAETEVIAKRESRSRPGYGLVTVRSRGFKPDGTTVIEFERTILVPKRETQQR